MNKKIIGKEILHFESLDSTNDFILDNTGILQEGFCVFANIQTKGKGRKGRIWQSTDGVGLYFSFLLKPKIELEKIPRITIVVALGISKALSSLGIESTLKWPNDIFLNGKKICGILTELKFIENQPNVVVGVGINLKHKVEDFEEEVRKVATSILIETGKSFDREEILNIILDEVDKEYQKFLETGDIDKDYYNSHNLLKKCLIRQNDAILQVNILEIDKEGNLIVENNGEILTLSGGEINICE